MFVFEWVLRMTNSWRWAGHVARMEEGKSTFKMSTGKPTLKITIGKFCRRWNKNIRTDLKEIGIRFVRLRIGIIEVSLWMRIESLGSISYGGSYLRMTNCLLYVRAITVLEPNRCDLKIMLVVEELFACIHSYICTGWEMWTRARADDVAPNRAETIPVAREWER